MHLNGQQRVASQAEEVLVHADLLDRKNALERLGDTLRSVRCSRSNGRWFRRFRSAALSAGLGSRERSTFAFGVSGNLCNETK